MFNSDNIPFLGTDLDDQPVMPPSEDGLSVESTAPPSDHTRLPLDLNRELIKRPASTFFVRLHDESLKNEGDLLIVDKSTEPYDGCLVVAFVDGEFILKRIKIEDDTIWIVSAKDNYKPIKVEPGNEHTIWGVVKYLIKKM